jgi:hypothetical protein
MPWPMVHDLLLTFQLPLTDAKTGHTNILFSVKLSSAAMHRDMLCSKSFKAGRSSDDQILRFLSGVDFPCSTATKGLTRGTTSDLVVNDWNSRVLFARFEQ